MVLGFGFLGVRIYGDGLRAYRILDLEFGFQKIRLGVCVEDVHSWKLTWKPKRGPIKTTVPLKWSYMGFHVSLGECRIQGFGRFLLEGPELRFWTMCCFGIPIAACSFFLITL